MKHKIYCLFIKRLIDILLSFVLIVFLIPVYFVFSITNIIFLGFPIFFVQERIGYKNKIFKIIKFKSMKNMQHDESDEKRLNGYGRFIRNTSIDELPELFNIFIGKMSFIGPRPLLIEYLPLYNSFQIKRHNVKPGLTGLAQINGRNLVSWEQKFEYDVFYSENASFLLDVKIFFKTIGVVLSRKGINQLGSATAEKFKGNPKDE